MTDTRMSEADLQATEAQPNTSTAGTPDLPRAIVLTDHGDMTLLIGDDEESQQPVLVSKVSMSHASPVWKAMFAQYWIESEATEILLPDDDIDAMLLVLRIAHLRFQEIPQKNGLGLEALLNLAVVCDKYDLVGLVRPFLNLHCWAETLIPDIKSVINCHPYWLFVSWTFGYVDTFESLASYLALTTALSPNGAATFGKDAMLFPDDLPPQILESILRVRRDAISDVAQACQALVEDLMENHDCKVRGIQKDRMDQRYCRPMMLGSCMEWFLARKLYPKDAAARDVLVSVKLLLEDLINRNFVLATRSHDFEAIAQYCNTTKFRSGIRASDLSSQGVKSHIGCHTGWEKLEAEGIRIMREMKSPMLDSHRRHMEEQAKK